MGSVQDGQRNETRGLWLPLLLFGLFIVQRSLSSLFVGANEEGQIEWSRIAVFVGWLLLILLAREIGHYGMARRHGLPLSWPYFVPINFPIGPIIRPHDPFSSRKAIFDVGAAGALMGIAASLLVTSVGLTRTTIVDVSGMEDAVFFPEAPIFRWLALLVVGERPPGTDIVLEPTLFAGMAGLSIIAWMLLPLSNFDGGFMAIGMLGKRHRMLAWVALVVILLSRIALWFDGSFSTRTILGLVIAVAVGMIQPIAYDDSEGIGGRRMLLGIALFCTIPLLTP